MFSMTDFPFGSGPSEGTTGIVPILGSPFLLAYGVVTGVPVTGAPGTVILYATSPSAFTTFAYPTVSLSAGSAWSGWQLSHEEFSLTPLGFEIVVSGGPPGGTITVQYQAIGY